LLRVAGDRPESLVNAGNSEAIRRSLVGGRDAGQFPASKDLRSQAAGEELLRSTERQLINAVHRQAVTDATLLTVSHNPIEDPVRHTYL